MKRNLMLIGICLTAFFTATLAAAKEKKGPMTGTWDCAAHGSTRGDIQFTLFLNQHKESLDGSISSPMGGTDISSGTFRHNNLEIHLDTPEGNYILLAKFHKDTLSGTWSSDNEKGTWTGKKKAPGSQ
jgi:hypothetical protein